MDLIAPIDAGFLMAESRSTPMHVGGIQIFEKPDGAEPDWLSRQYARMLEHTEPAPLFAKRPRRSWRAGGQWVWERDERFDLEYHVRHSALPGPGRVRELFAVASRLHGSLLDRQRPLWEMNIIEGLEGDRFAIYTKIHHAMVDGVSALRLLERTLSPDPEAEVAPPWTHRRPSSSRRAPSAVDTALEIARGGVDLAGMIPIMARAAQKAATEELAAFPFKAPPSMFNVHITGARRFAADGWDLERLRRVARAEGATLNDIVLAMCSGALRRYLLECGELPDEPLTALVPVSLRRDDSAGGNALGAILTSLATASADPVDRLDRIRRSVGMAKESLQELSPIQILALSGANMVPSPLISMLGGGEGFRPPFNLIISNVPGPQHPLHLNGARLVGVYPMSIPYHGQALNITVTTYDGSVEFGLTGCRRRVPSLQRILVHLEDTLVELEGAVGLDPT